MNPANGSTTNKNWARSNKRWFRSDLQFVELPTFTEAWDKELRLGDDDLAELQLTIMRRPDIGPVIPGAGGLRKLRFSPSTWQQGKRGALRVCYAVFPVYGVALLAAVYTKNERADLSAAEKQTIARHLREYEHELERQRKLKRPHSRSR